MRGGEGDVFVCVYKCVLRKLSVKALKPQSAENDGSEGTLGMDNDGGGLLTRKTLGVGRKN